MARPRLTKIFGILALLLLVLITLGITFTIGWRPFIGAKARPVTERHFESTPDRLARGKYLVEAVNGCVGCHSPADISKPGAPYQEGKEGAGEVWPDKQLPWLVAPNITSDKETGIGNWSDDVLARAIREGIGHDGRALFPVMPYTNFRSMSDDDLASVIVYIRTLPPIKSQLPQTRIPFPLSFLIKSMPEPINGPVAPPDSSTAVSRGAYLVKMGSCGDCHTPQERGQPIAGMEFAGGFALNLPTGTIATTNITPDVTGISYYDENLFLRAMHEGKVGARQLNAAMPWWYFGKMNDDDLRSIFAFLKSLKPVSHRVDNVEPPTECKRCRQKHGLGDKN
ncbi:MAG TPA: c-type cytochrome [Pyrinomonadaceae bacterium]